MLYDLAIIGAGPAAYTAAIYAARYKLNTILIGFKPGGLASEAFEVYNYPSHIKISGLNLMKKFEEHARSLGVKIKLDLVKKISGSNNNFEIETEYSKEKFRAKKIIIASGTKKRRLNAKNEERFMGKGVSYCATCDGALFRDKVVGVVGGGDTALSSALLLARFASKVYIIYRRDKFFRAEPSWLEAVNKEKKIEKIFNANVVELKGDEFLKEVVLDNGKRVMLDGLFVEIGSLPETNFIEGLALNENGYILVDDKKHTNLKGVFAAGDVTASPLKQIITAAADGAIAANSAYEEISRGE